MIVRALTFPAPPDAVWALLVDLERQPTWMHDLKSITPSSTGPLGVGFRAVGRVRMFGVTQEDPIEVTAFEPGRHFGMTHGGGFTGRADFWLEPLPGGRRTRVTWREELRPDARRSGPAGGRRPAPGAARSAVRARCSRPSSGPICGVCGTS